MAARLKRWIGEGETAEEAEGGGVRTDINCTPLACWGLEAADSVGPGGGGGGGCEGRVCNRIVVAARDGAVRWCDAGVGLAGTVVDT